MLYSFPLVFPLIYTLTDPNLTHIPLVHILLVEMLSRFNLARFQIQLQHNYPLHSLDFRKVPSCCLIDFNKLYHFGYFQGHHPIMVAQILLAAL